MTIVPYGEGALFVTLEGDEPFRRAASQARLLAVTLREKAVDVVAGAGALAVVGDVRADEVAAELADPSMDVLFGPVTHEIPVLYDGADLAEVAAAFGVSTDELALRHARSTYEVAVLGFLPGFAYLTGGEVSDVPRRGVPRPRVPKGAVAVAAGFSGVYPAASPGGWNLLGTTRWAAFDDDGPRLRPLHRVRFVPVDALAPIDERPLVLDRGALRIVRAPAMATVQDGGRVGRLGDGLPPSGPLDREAHAVANAAVGNAADEAAVEVPWGRLEVEAEAPLTVSLDGAPPLRLGAGERVLFSPSRGVGYLAVAGGLDTDVVLGARAVHVACRIAGRPLARGDRLPVAHRRGAPRTERIVDGPLHVLPGPHLDRLAPGAFERFVASAFTVSPRSDRVGTRLDGARIPAPDARMLPAPLVRGAVQVTVDGTPIVMGPDHPVTGGYPVVAVLTKAAQARLARLAPGAPVRFAPR